MPNDTPVTIHDVAREAGVSYVTVSRVLNNKNVRSSTRERVMAAIEKLGYIPNPHARGLAGVSTKTVAVHIDSLTGGFFSEILRGIDEVLAEEGYDLVLYTRRQPENEASYVSMIARGMAEGIIVVIPRMPRAYLGNLRKLNFPHVLAVSEEFDGESVTVGATNEQGAYDGTKHLIDLGHERIGFVGLLRESAGALFDRLKGYQNALADHGIAFDPQLVQYTDRSQQDERAFDLTLELLQLPDPPTAIFASNDMKAIAAMDAIRSLGLSIPEDISVIGFDNLPETRLVRPCLTTVDQKVADIGRESARALLTQLNSPSAPKRRIELMTELVIRDSTAPRSERR